MDAADTVTISIPDAKLRSGRIVTAQSYLIDRFAPACETIVLPAQTVPGGTLTLHKGQMSLAPPQTAGRLKRITSRAPATEAVPHGRVAIDLRFKLFGNWAHLLNNHLPLTFRILSETDTPADQILLILPADAPGYLLKAAQLFGFDTHATDAIVEGQAIAYDMTPWIGQRAARADWARLPAARAALAAGLSRAEPAKALPKKVFLSRKDTRVPSNNAQVADWLAARGYDLIYAEDLSPADQMRLFGQASDIVAVHGAGLAPLLYCGADSPLGPGPDRLVEILPCGHMTDVYRVIAQQIGCNWIGVRGRMKPEYIRPAYDIGAGFSKFSLDSFEIDIAALEQAMDHGENDSGTAP